MSNSGQTNYTRFQKSVSKNKKRDSIRMNIENLRELLKPTISEEED